MLKVNIKNVYKTIFVIVGTIIGAGFASGQEIYTFFNRFGIKGLVGIAISTCLFLYIIFKTLDIVLKNNINNYQDFLDVILPSKLQSNRIMSFTINNIINIFLLISFNIMVAGFATYFFQELGLSKWVGAIIIAILTIITFLNNIDGVIKINSLLIPILIVLIIFLGIERIQNIKIESIYNNKESIYWILNSILYASYNSITLIPILIGLKKQVNTKNEICLISLGTAIIMFILSVTIFLLMNTFINQVRNVEIPIIFIAKTLGNGFKYIYGVVILIAIFTTAIGAGYSFLNNITNKRRTYIIYAILMCILSVFIGQLGFSSLINCLYPIFGYLGIIQIILLIIKQSS